MSFSVINYRPILGLKEILMINTVERTMITSLQIIQMETRSMMYFNSGHHQS